MARNRRNASAVSLFPFLAVLMCTMGALIVLLVVISQQIRDDTLAKAREARQEQVAQAQTAGSAKPDEVPEKPTVPEDEPLLPELAESEDPLEPLLPLPELDAIRQDVAHAARPGHVGEARFPCARSLNDANQRLRL